MKIMKRYLFYATALIALACCSSNDYVGDDTLREASTNAPITFGFDVPAVTRAGGSEAATALGNQFIVWGEKSETTDGSAAASGNLVFKNYLVNYTANTAYTTTSNTKDWEYVGISNTYSGENLTPNSGTDAQTIKYWDYGASNYVFTAVSAQQTDITNGKVKITKTESGSTVYDKGYSIVVTDEANLDKLFFSNRQPITKSSNADRTQENTYGGNVKLIFRNAISKVRAAMFETVPGYDVKIVKFYTQDSEAPTFTGMTTENTTNFAANITNYSPASDKTSVAGTFTVKYYPQNDDNDAAGITNHATISFAGVGGTTIGNVLTLGTNIISQDKLAYTSAEPTFDNSDKSFTTVFPKEDNDKNLKLKVDYDLKNSVSSEVIHVTGATAEVPAAYLKWKPNYKYTYIFKISDNTNGSSGTPGTDPAGLYPITFDAVTIEAENGTAEYITTVSEPSITTFGYNTTTNKYITDGNDYPASTNVYATVEDASSLATLSESNFSIYEVTTSNDTNFPVTEASVAEALIEGPTWTKAQTELKKITCSNGPTLTFCNTVPAENGTTITLHASETKAAKFTTVGNKKYALVYQKTAATYNTDGGKNDYTSETFTDAGTLYTDASCNTKADTWSSGTTYYKRTAVTNKGVYAIKIVTCPAP